MRDPFVDGGCGAIIIGADCCVCNASVCISSVGRTTSLKPYFFSQECSFFYGKRYCKSCALNNLDHFPGDIHKVGRTIS